MPVADPEPDTATPRWPCRLPFYPRRVLWRESVTGIILATVCDAGLAVWHLNTTGGGKRVNHSPCTSD